MTRILKQRGIELIGDESGVALALTVTVAIVIFLFGFAVYAVGETVRERIELQNAADAAAYSGALVQADTISRVAVINKAMAWNYVMMTRRQMDYIVDSWLRRFREVYQNTYQMTVNLQRACSCPHHQWVGSPFDCWVGLGPSGMHNVVLLNGWQSVNVSVIDRARSGHAARNSAAQLEQLRRCVDAMNKAETALINGMERRIRNAVDFAVEADVSTTANDDLFKSRRGGDSNKIKWTCVLKSASTYFEVLKRDEMRFLGFSGDGFSGSPAGAKIFNTGADTWLVQSSGSGFRRDYRQTGSSLRADWSTFNRFWVDIKWGCVPYHAMANLNSGPFCVTGDMARDRYFTGQVASPQVLKDNFFDADGAIVVGVSRPLNNPLGFVYGGGDKKAGIYSAFAIGGGGEKMWGVAAARAGYRKDGWKTGEYRNRGRIDAADNLKIADWDAVFLPVNDKHTAAKGILGDLAKKLGATTKFGGRELGSYSTIDFEKAISHVHH